MSIYLNTDKCLQNYKELVNEKYFVDKSSMIELLNNRISTKSKYVCVTKPRRFGKSSVVHMIGAYYSKVVNSRYIFDGLKVSKYSSYNEHLNKYNVINISFNKLPNKMESYDEYISLIQRTLIDDIRNLYSDIEFKSHFTISDMLFMTKDKFIFIFDEWDYIFNSNLFTENQNDFLEFLRNLLKDQPYVALHT